MSRKITFSVGEYYHVYNRGTDKREIFLDNSDRERFVKLLYLANGSKPIAFRYLPTGLHYTRIEKGKPVVALGAYCLMPNHFHLLIKETNDDGITKFLGKMSTSYSMYFNKKYERTGSLFEGPFKATHVESDEYLKYLFSYIHLNPLKLINEKWKEDKFTKRAATKTYLMNYRYSSYVDYIGKKRPEKILINKKEFPKYFLSDIDFESFIDDWLDINSSYSLSSSEQIEEGEDITR